MSIVYLVYTFWVAIYFCPQGRLACVLYDAYMHHGQNRGDEKTRKSGQKTHKSNEILENKREINLFPKYGEKVKFRKFSQGLRKFFGNRWKSETGGKCVIALGEMEALGCPTRARQSTQHCYF